MHVQATANATRVSCVSPFTHCVHPCHPQKVAYP